MLYRVTHKLVSQAFDQALAPIASSLKLDPTGVARLSQAIIPPLMAGIMELPIDMFTTALANRIFKMGIGGGMIGLSFIPEGINPRTKTDLWTMGAFLLIRALTSQLQPKAIEEIKGNAYAISNGIQYGSPESVVRGLFRVPKGLPDFGNVMGGLSRLTQGQITPAASPSVQVSSRQIQRAAPQTVAEAPKPSYNKALF